MMQGIIDLFFIENNEVVLLDYKTDNINNIEELANKYNTQMKYYKIAIESITGLKVKEVYIYSFKAGCEVLLDI
jgi:ATP-dependent helicase/nuclease subunit A